MAENSHISSADARAEGVDHWPDSAGRRDPFPALRFKDLWTSLHGKASWYENPEVVALTFKIHHANIDTILEEQKHVA